MKEGEARDFLALFDFRGDEVYQKIATLSGGEKGCLSLARIVFGGANLLLLDEPTNHLDLDAREALEDALLEFEGAIVFVSHDRWFVDRIATQVLEIAPGGVVELHEGNYSHLVRRKKERLAPSQAVSPERGERQRGTGNAAFSSKGNKKSRGATRTALAHPGAPSAHTPSRESPSSSSSSSPDRAAERRRAKNMRILSDLEEAIAKLEAEVRALELSLADPDVYRDGAKARGVSSARDAARKALEAKLWEWEETSRKLETGEGVPA
jgi:ATP-binding cassette subfamily F protein 3